MTKGTQGDLRRRIALLGVERIVTGRRGKKPPPVAKLLDVVGDLTLYQVKELVDLAIADHNAAIMASIRGEPSPENVTGLGIYQE